MCIREITRVGLVVIIVGTVVFLSDAAGGGIYPPAKGKTLPLVYFEQVSKNPQSYTFKHAYLSLVQRIAHNRMMLEQGLMEVAEAEVEGGIAMTGTRAVPVLLGLFANTGSAPCDSSDLQIELFDGPWPDGTMSDYYQEISYGAFDVTGKVYDWVSVSQDDTFYEGPSSCQGLRPACGAKTGQFIKEILDAKDPEIDFRQYDNDGPDGIPDSGDDDGYVDVVMFVHPDSGGECASETNNIWSHHSAYSEWPAACGRPYPTKDIGASGDSIRIEDYTIQPTLACGSGTMIEIGIFCHEYGHALGLPDLYDTDDGNGASHGIGGWGLMGLGSWGGDWKTPQTPTHMCGWSKMTLGWLTPTVIDVKQEVTLVPVETTPQAVKLWEDPREPHAYFLMENRQQLGFDASLTGPGMLIWHIAPSVTTWNDDHTHKYVDLEEADGYDDLDHKNNIGDDGDPYPGSLDVRDFDTSTYPSSDDYNRQPTWVACHWITESGPDIVFTCAPRHEWGLMLCRDDTPGLLDDVGVTGANFKVTQPGTTWFGADATGTSVVPGGVWDFDNRGTLVCPTEDDWHEYIANGAFAQGWTSEEIGGVPVGGTSALAAIRDASSFLNNDACGLDNCNMAGCVLAFYSPVIAGQYGTGGHFLYAGAHQRAWSPSIDFSAYPPRGYVLKYDRYADLPLDNWIFYRHYVSYVQDVNCPAGVWSEPMTDNYAYYCPQPSCREGLWSFSEYVPVDADSVKVGLSAWSGWAMWDGTPTEGNESPIFDNVRVGTWDLSGPQAGIRAVDNYTDAFPEAYALTSGSTALIDIAQNLSQRGDFLRLGDSLVITLDHPDVQAELCFRIRPGPGTNLSDQFFTTKYPDGGGWSACEISDDYFCTRMDTAFYAGDGDTASAYEFQVVEEGRFASMIHEEDPLYWAEGEEIFPDTLFTPGTMINYAIRTSYIGGLIYQWLPFGADMNDPETLYEVEVLPDLCKDPVACLLYVDYFNRGAQGPIEDALTMLGRTWDRLDLRAESSHQGNGIGNRWLGPDRRRLDRTGQPDSDALRIGPSLNHLTQYNALLVNSGSFGHGVVFSDGGAGTVKDPTNDIKGMKKWLIEGRWKGLWLSGDNIASDFANAAGGVKVNFLNNELGAQLVAENYREMAGHSVEDSCVTINTRDGEWMIENEYSVQDFISLSGLGCPQAYEFDVLALDAGAPNDNFVSAAYWKGGSSFYGASVDHIFRTYDSPFDTVRTKLDGFSVHSLRNYEYGCGTDNNVGIALWIRDVLGGTDNRGYFFDRGGSFQYCPPDGPENLAEVPRRDKTYRYALFQNFPNPFGGGAGTTIHYSVARAGNIEIHIFDVAGRLVNRIVDQAELGDNFLVWNGKSSDGRSLSSGVYFYQIKAGNFRSHKKMLLIN